VQEEPSKEENMTKINTNKLENFIADSRKVYEHYLGELVEVPTVSTDPAYGEDILKGANLAASFLTEMGGRTEIVKTAGYPVVLGHFDIHPGAPTIAIYHHLDVQPASPSKWVHPPFKFTVTMDGRYLGRGTTDDKGPALAALFAARYILDEHIPINIKFIWEMEEEIGSPHFAEAIRSKKDEIHPDSILVSDSIWISRDKPAITYGLRGMMAATLTLTTADRDAHSGLVGGVARNPVAELCQVISQCFDPLTGRVKIEGFYDKVREPCTEELLEFKNSKFSVSEFKEANGLRMLRTEDVSRIIQATWCEPTFEVHGLVGGYMGSGIMTIVPHTAEAKVSTRLVPDQSPGEIFHMVKDFVKKLNPDVVVELESTLEPYLTDFSGPHAQAAREAVSQGFGLEPVFIRGGGSIGSVVSMQNLWGVPIVLVGLSLPEHGYHAPNEYFDWSQASGGIRALAHYLSMISQLDR
jgi:acetylornithine deacetylase/succinyl-diaminopimelate desuccinylase-like protein